MPKPIYRDKINEYLDRLYVQQPDTLTKAIEKIVSKAKKNQETYKYAVWTCMLKYQQPRSWDLMRCMLTSMTNILQPEK
jgi:hypothetical protein